MQLSRAMSAVASGVEELRVRERATGDSFSAEETQGDGR
jgi:hypothetical protein